MIDRLLSHVRRLADFHADRSGIARTPIPGLTLVRASSPSAVDYTINRPLVALILQGAKRVATGARIQELHAGQSLLISADIPTSSEITQASPAVPYYSLVLDLDPGVIRGLALEMGPVEDLDGTSLHVDQTDPQLADAMRRLLQTLDRPASIPILQAQLLREVHYWLLAGRHGATTRNLGLIDSHSERIGRAIAVMRDDFGKSIPIAELAAVANMSLASFHHHFRQVTSLTPLQFQKQLRLIEARRLLMSEGASASSVAYAVGYESVSHFTREYGRMFGRPPARDAKETRDRVESAI